MQKEIQSFGVTPHQEKLKNGARIFMFYKKTAPITLAVYFLAGSRFDKIPGVAHCMEHLLVAGTKKFPTKNILTRTVENIGGQLSVATNQNTVKIVIELPDTDNLTTGIDILHEIIFHPLFNKEKFVTETKAILSEIGVKKSNPSMQVWDLIREGLFNGTDLKNPTLGTPKTISLISLDKVIDHYKKFVINGKFDIFVSGDFDTGRMVGLLSPKFESLRVDSEYVEGISKENGLDVKAEVFQEYRGEQNHIILGFVFPAITPHQQAVLDVLTTLIGSGRASILSEILRDEKGLVYVINSSSKNYLNKGAFFIKTSCLAKNTDEVIKICENTLDTLAKIPNERIDFAKEKIIKSLKMKLQTSLSWVSFHEDMLFYENPETLLISAYAEEVSQVNKDDVLNFISKNFLQRKKSIAICGPKKEKVHQPTLS